MIHTDTQDTKPWVHRCKATQEVPLSDDHKSLARDVLDRLCSKWALWVMHVLGQADGPMRFARVLEAVEGISQKVLTRTLRQLECDGFITRTLYPQVPPRVEYALTDLGKDLLNQIAPLFTWVITEVRSFQAARTRFAERAG